MRSILYIFNTKVKKTKNKTVSKVIFKLGVTLVVDSLSPMMNDA